MAKFKIATTVATLLITQSVMFSDVVDTSTMTLEELKAKVNQDASVIEKLKKQVEEQNETPVTKNGTTTLDEIKVTTAGGHEQLVKDASASITVISAEKLNEKSYTSVVDAIKNVPGVYVNNEYGSNGESEGISIRGMAVTETLYLVDGKPLTNGRNFGRAAGTAGQANGLNNMLPPISMIERIEIVRGPASSLYGGNALGGVINIITKKATKEWTGSFNVEYLTPDSSNEVGDNKLATNVFTQGPLIDNLLALQINASHTKKDGGGVRPNPTDANPDATAVVNGSETKGVGGKLILTPDDYNDISADYKYSEKKTVLAEGTAETVANTTPYTKDVYTFSHDGRYGNLSTSTYYQNEETTKEGTTSSADVIETNNILNHQSTYALGEHILVFGGQYKEEEFKDPAQALRKIDRWQGAVFAEGEWSVLDDLLVTTGLRYNDDELFGGHLSPRLYGVYHLTDNWTLKGGVTTGYSQPTISAATEGWTQGYGRGLWLGNPDLEPEESVNYELGLHYEDKEIGLTSSAVLFQTDYKNKIVPNRVCQPTGSSGSYTGCEQYGATATNGFVNKYENVADAEMKGIELATNYDILENLQAGASYTFTKSEVKDGVFNKGMPSEIDLSGKTLNKTPEHMLNLTLDYQPTAKWNLWGQWNYRGKSTEYLSFDHSTEEQPETPSYYTSDLGVVYKATKDLSFKAGIYNVENKQITDADYGITLDGRRYSIAMNLKF
ncbi:TonB-dependent receptor domain-containing protein [Aliarcobacter butzleri]|uniref:TonB-dependent receptor domain-containing protein n=1 Tax=Aliarcobacter butzleri TaxID=28197 RepID=UPI0021B5682C|nr:TonB-dependent receptor [Aliarcobacter butzleri]MCT7579669.1 TonB-dependent receptor [Aliarcobacter butzleri]